MTVNFTDRGKVVKNKYDEIGTSTILLQSAGCRHDDLSLPVSGSSDAKYSWYSPKSYKDRI